MAPAARFFLATPKTLMTTTDYTAAVLIANAAPIARSTSGVIVALTIPGSTPGSVTTIVDTTHPPARHHRLYHRPHQHQHHFGISIIVAVVAGIGIAQRYRPPPLFPPPPTRHHQRLKAPYKEPSPLSSVAHTDPARRRLPFLFVVFFYSAVRDPGGT